VHHDAAAVGLSLMSDALNMIMATAAGELVMWDRRSLSKACVLSPSNSSTPLMCVSCGRDAPVIASGDVRSIVRVYDLRHSGHQDEIETNSQAIMDVALDGPGRTIASAGFGGLVQVFHHSKGSWVHRCCLQDGKSKKPIMAVAVSRDGRFVAKNVSCRIASHTPLHPSA
jgi:WD40 repeat protein